MARSGARRLITAVVGVGLVWGARSTAAHACGQSTHVWTALHARTHLPSGPLRDLLFSTQGELAVINGTMFPDGGYSPLSSDPYGEIAHWEPFQDRVFATLPQLGTDVTAGAAGVRFAFGLGLAAHGIGDQVFDAAFMYRSRAFDAEGWLVGEFDTATDVLFVHQEAPAPVVDDAIVPYEALQALFADGGHAVDLGTMRLGQASLRFAIEYVGRAADTPASVADHAQTFPWADDHLLDPMMPGSPPCIGDVVAAYWQVLYDRALDRFDVNAQPVMFSFPVAGGTGWTADHESADSLISVVLSRAVVEAELPSGVVALEDAAGRRIAVDAWMFYRGGSHVLNVRPTEPLTEASEHTLTLTPPPEGVAMLGETVWRDPWRLTFSTAGERGVSAHAVPDDPGGGASDAPTDADPAAGSSGCAVRGRPGPVGALVWGAALLIVRRKHVLKQACA